MTASKKPTAATHDTPSAQGHGTKDNTALKQAQSSGSPPVLTNRVRGFTKKASSFSAVVADLEVGECASRVQAIPANMTMGQLAEQLPGIKATLQNNSTSAIRLAKQATGGTYTATVSDTITASGKLYAILIIERTS